MLDKKEAPASSFRTRKPCKQSSYHWCCFPKLIQMDVLNLVIWTPFLEHSCCSFIVSISSLGAGYYPALCGRKNAQRAYVVGNSARGWRETGDLLHTSFPSCTCCTAGAVKLWRMVVSSYLALDMVPQKDFTYVHEAGRERNNRQPLYSFWALNIRYVWSL